MNALPDGDYEVRVSRPDACRARDPKTGLRCTYPKGHAPRKRRMRGTPNRKHGAWTWEGGVGTALAYWPALTALPERGTE